MIAFVDTSVLLRKLLGEPGPLAEWKQIERAFASRLLPLEAARTIDRLRLEARLDDEEVALLHTELRRVLRSVEIRGITEALLLRAASAMPTVVGTLDALHLVSALEVAQELGSPPIFATHDIQLGRAARASGLEVVGV